MAGGDDYRMVQSGDPLRITAAAWNEVVRHVRGLPLDGGQGFLQAFAQSGIVKVRNDSGSVRERFDILGIETPIIDPDANENEFQRRVTLTGVTPQAKHAGRFVVLLAPLGVDQIGWGLVAGVVQVRLPLEAVADEQFVDVTAGDCSVLTPSASGSARVLWVETTNETAEEAAARITSLGLGAHANNYWLLTLGLGDLEEAAGSSPRWAIVRLGDQASAAAAATGITILTKTADFSVNATSETLYIIRPAVGQNIVASENALVTGTRVHFRLAKDHGGGIPDNTGMATVMGGRRLVRHDDAITFIGSGSGNVIFSDSRRSHGAQLNSGQAIGVDGGLPSATPTVISFGGSAWYTNADMLYAPVARWVAVEVKRNGTYLVQANVAYGGTIIRQTFTMWTRIFQSFEAYGADVPGTAPGVEMIAEHVSSAGATFTAVGAQPAPLHVTVQALAGDRFYVVAYHNAPVTLGAHATTTFLEVNWIGPHFLSPD